MRPEKLEGLFASFVANRTEIDVVDAVAAQGNGNIAAEFENPVPHFGYEAQIYVGEGYVNELYEPLSAVQSTQVADAGRQLAQLAAQFSSNRPDKCSVTFARSCIIVSPEEQTISITVKRSHGCDKVTKVTWKTCDRTALSGAHYVGSSGEIVFDKGVTEEKIEIKILQFDVDDVIDLRFNVELSVIDDGFDPKPITVTLKKTENFYEDEKQVVSNLPFSPPFSIEDIRCVLKDSLTSRTFHMALTHLCSNADSVHLEFALAFELSRYCFRSLSKESIFNVLNDFFRNDDIDF